jgi:hypothetical protein
MASLCNVLATDGAAQYQSEAMARSTDYFDASNSHDGERITSFMDRVLHDARYELDRYCSLPDVSPPG